MGNLLMRLLDWFRPRPAPAPKPIPPTPAPVPDDATIPAQVIAAMNGERARRGLRPLIEDPKLNAIALSWSHAMARNGRISHGNFAGRIEAAYPGSLGAENVAGGYGTVTEVMMGWMSSPPHRANILAPGYTLAGIGRATDAQGNFYWTGDFSTPVGPHV